MQCICMYVNELWPTVCLWICIYRSRGRLIVGIFCQGRWAWSRLPLSTVDAVHVASYPPSAVLPWYCWLLLGVSRLWWSALTSLSVTCLRAVTEPSLATSPTLYLFHLSNIRRFISTYFLSISFACWTVDGDSQSSTQLTKFTLICYDSIVVWLDIYKHFTSLWSYHRELNSGCWVVELSCCARDAWNWTFCFICSSLRLSLCVYVLEVCVDVTLA